MNATIRVHNCDLSFSDEDIVNPDDFIPRGEYNPHNVRPWLLHDHGFALAVVFADCLQDAIDIAVDADKLDRYLIHPDDENERDDYLTSDPAEMDAGLDPECPEYTSPDGTRYWWKGGVTPSFLGNASEPFDIESLGYVELTNPAFSFAAMFSADNAARVLSSHFA